MALCDTAEFDADGTQALRQSNELHPEGVMTKTETRAEKSPQEKAYWADSENEYLDFTSYERGWQARGASERERALEEAAELCECYDSVIARAVRALKGKP